MTWHFYFRYHRNITFSSISNYLFYLLLSIKSSVYSPICISTNGPYFSQPWIFLYFYCPKLVVSQVPMKSVHFQHSHYIKLFFNKLYTVKMSPNIQQHTTIWVNRFIIYYNTRSLPSNSFDFQVTFNL